jgi:hypothetical protein
MNPPPPELAELQALLAALCEETITPEQVQRLEDLVLASPEAEAYYVQFMSLHADLVAHFSVLPGLTEESLQERAGETRPRGRTLTRKLLTWGSLGLTGLAAGLLLALSLWPRPSGVTNPPRGEKDERTDNTVAVLLRTPKAVWESTDMPTRPGSPLPPGVLRLKSGFAHIEFYSGATVVLEGPAELRLLSRLEAYCARGKLWATVPPSAQGFTIGSPRLDLVDRGTEFGLDVAEGGKTSLHVFKGKVDVYKPGDRVRGGAPGTPRNTRPQKELGTSEGVATEKPGELSDIRADAKAFQSAQDLAARAEAEARTRHKAWLDASAALRKDKGLALYYPLQSEDLWNRTLEDQARERRKPCDGAIVGCSWVTGRWSGKQGLEFKRVSDRVRLHVPGTFNTLTLAAWVRVDALPNRFNSLFMTDGWDDAEPHWHISDTGRIELGVQGPNKKGGVHYLTGEVITPDRLGQWVHLAVVHDRPGKQVTHYVDGQVVMREALKLNLALRLGDAEVGNWNVDTHRSNKSPVRYFSGCIDEFLLFSRALTDEDVERLYAQGRPPQ